MQIYFLQPSLITFTKGADQHCMLFELYCKLCLQNTKKKNKNKKTEYTANIEWLSMEKMFSAKGFCTHLPVGASWSMLINQMFD